ncbi:MAG: sigma-70 family RNA polymerase sigma factor [Myxococcales bacterium]|nr:sigma-70 family RNA polymerase sigma factor [Myxococcales bacterium]
MDERSHERELLLAWRDGDRAAGSRLIRSHAAMVQRFFANKLSNTEQVEELSQRTFAACVSGVERFRGDSNFRTWLFAVANNVLREYFRENRRQSKIDFGEFSVQDAGGGPSTVLGASQEQQLLLAALRRIPIDSQVLLELYYWEGLTAPELAEVMAMPVGTVRGRISKAKLALRAELDTMERTGGRPQTTEAQLDDWARELRARLERS